MVAFPRKWLSPYLRGGTSSQFAGKTVLLSEALTAEQTADATLCDKAIVLSGPKIPLRYHADWYWADDRNVFLQGYLFIPDVPITAFRYVSDGERVDIERSPRPDLGAIHGTTVDSERAGFCVLMPFRAGAPILLEVTTALGITRLSLIMNARSKVSGMSDSAYSRFVCRANRPGVRILEIGSRVVGATSLARAIDFPLAAQFVGVDIHPGPGVDLVCDAHALSSVFRPGSFDFVFSLSVLEHLAMPWQVAGEINRLLAMGGEVMKSVPFSYPLHEMPNDFWRFTDQGLQQLFGPEFGFGVIDSGMSCEVRMFPEWRSDMPTLPLNAGFAEAWIISHKIAECNNAQATTANQVAPRSRRYPGQAASEMSPTELAARGDRTR